MLKVYNEGRYQGESRILKGVVELMKIATNEDGHKLFKSKDYFRKEQISAYFSHFTYQRRKGVLVKELVSDQEQDGCGEETIDGEGNALESGD